MHANQLFELATPQHNHSTCWYKIRAGLFFFFHAGKQTTIYLKSSWMGTIIVIAYCCLVITLHRYSDLVQCSSQNRLETGCWRVAKINWHTCVRYNLIVSRLSSPCNIICTVERRVFDMQWISNNEHMLCLTQPRFTVLIIDSNGCDKWFWYNVSSVFIMLIRVCHFLRVDITYGNEFITIIAIPIINRYIIIRWTGSHNLMELIHFC